MQHREGRVSAGDGLQLAYSDFGDLAAPPAPLLCLPGLTRNAADFRDIARRYGDSRRVICPDYRGRARSAYDADWRHYTPATYLSDIRHLLAALGVHQVVVIGTSLGGILAMAMGAYMPLLATAVVLNDIGPDIDPAGLAPIKRFIAENRSHVDLDTAARYMLQMFPDLPADNDEDARRVTAGCHRQDADGRWRFDFDPAIGRGLSADRVEAADLWPLFGSLAGIPVLTLRGERSNILAAATLARMAEVHPGMWAVTVPGRGHVPSLAEPSAAAALDGFLADV